MRHVLLAFVFALTACTSHDHSKQDGPVLTAALKHLVTQPESMIGPPTGIVLLQTDSQDSQSQWTANDVEAIFREKKLSAPREAFEDFILRNSTEAPYPALGDIGVAARYEDRNDDPAHASMELGKTVISMITLRRPGYANDGRTAIVDFSFTWSWLHGGNAMFVLARSQAGEWQVVEHHTDVSL